MLTFKSFLRESTDHCTLSDRQFDFLGHLMASHDDHSTIHRHMHEETVNEVTLIDKRKPAAAAPVSEPTDHEMIHGTVNMLTHPAVSGNHPVKNAEEVGRYKALMKRGTEIAKTVGGAHKHVADGFHKYMSGVNQTQHGFEDPRKTKKSQLSASKNLFKEHTREVGYKSATAPDLLGGNVKTEKNEKLGDITAGLSLAPARTANIGKHTSCAKATSGEAGCEHVCLGHTTGKNALLSNINSKVAKHQFFVQHPEHAARILHSELLNHVDKVHEYNQERAKTGEKPLEASYRPNVVTDFNHPKMSADMINHVTEHARRKGVKFTVRDYTKHAERLYQPRPANYHLALSHTGTDHDESNDHDVSKALAHGHTVAAVIHGNATHFFDHKTNRAYPIDDGDSDDRIEDGHKNVGHSVAPDNTGRNHKGQPEGVVRALRIKGSSGAVKDAAGAFVSRTTENFVHPETGHRMNVVEINKHHKSPF